MSMDVPKPGATLTLLSDLWDCQRSFQDEDGDVWTLSIVYGYNGPEIEWKAGK